jgi:hypothetical protein
MVPTVLRNPRMLRHLKACVEGTLWAAMLSVRRKQVSMSYLYSRKLVRLEIDSNRFSSLAFYLEQLFKSNGICRPAKVVGLADPPGQLFRGRVSFNLVSRG